jgi:hypothetical protein
MATLYFHKNLYSMIQLPSSESLPDRCINKTFVFSARTNKELSIICPSEYIQ